MSIYCPGENCSRRNSCAKHNPPAGWHQVIDWSAQGSGSIGGTDDYGNYFGYDEYYCGDFSIGYPKYEIIIQLDNAIINLNALKQKKESEE